MPLLPPNAVHSETNHHSNHNITATTVSMADDTSGNSFDSIEDTIQAFRNNEFIIVLDSPSRENEGDLIISASQITSAQVSFMVRYTSGLICAPMPSSLTQTLSLPQMVSENQDPKSTAYTLSVDAANPSISTGISAHDRALTCRVLADPKATEASFRRPGHVFPLRAREGGVRERRGHTEAAVEFCRLAGAGQVGVIAELVEDVQSDDENQQEGGESQDGHVDGQGDQEVSNGVIVNGAENTKRTNKPRRRKAEIQAEQTGGMMRRDACLAFGRKWRLKVCTIEALVEYLDKS